MAHDSLWLGCRTTGMSVIQAAQIKQRGLEAQARGCEERLARAKKMEARLRALANARSRSVRYDRPHSHSRHLTPVDSAFSSKPRNLLTKTTKKATFLTVKWMKQKINISPAVRELAEKYVAVDCAVNYSRVHS